MQRYFHCHLSCPAIAILIALYRYVRNGKHRLGIRISSQAVLTFQDRRVCHFEASNVLLCSPRMFSVAHAHRRPKTQTSSTSSWRKKLRSSVGLDAVVQAGGGGGRPVPAREIWGELIVAFVSVGGVVGCVLV